MWNKQFAFGLCLMASTFSVPAISAPITVQSVLFDYDGDASTVGAPYIDQNGNQVQNGDFTIFRIPEAADLPVGNGIDDRTRGIFDFRGDANYIAFSELLSLTHGKIFSATLSLILTPMDSLFINDQINLENGPFVGYPETGKQLQPNDVAKLVTLNLLDFYSQQQLENFLSGGVGDFLSDGRIVFTYGDDSIVSGAALRLTANVPEPGTFSLLSLGLLLPLARRLKRKQTACYPS